jgi:hypothetical protein
VSNYAGDVITAVNGKDVINSRDLVRRIASIASGTSVTLAVLHNGENKTVSLTRRPRSRHRHIASPDIWTRFADFYAQAVAASKSAYGASQSQNEADPRKAIAQLRTQCKRLP